MSNVQEILIDLQEKYGKVRNLIEDDSKKDPETEPYRSKYKARAMLTDMKDVITDLLSSGENEKFKTMLSVVLLQLGIISLDTEELSSGETQLNECLEIISGSQITPHNILIVISAKNQLGILWAQRSQPLQAQKHLEDAEHFYVEFVQSGQETKSLHEYFGCNKEEDLSPAKELEKSLTLTKFYLAQVYGTLKDVLKSAMYCHETLKRQVENKDYEPVDWALNSATLSQFFMEKYRFRQARHHLAASNYILDQYEDHLKQIELSEEELEAKNYELKHRFADIYRCWSKYGIFLLGYSKSREILEMDESLEELYFDSLELTLYENQITDQLLETYDDARDVFLITQKFLNQAKEFYNLEDHASDFVEITHDHSQLFKCLIMFELDEERQCKMHKKRLDLLESVVTELNPQYYLFACRKIWFELGEIYNDMMSLKYNKLQSSDELTLPNVLKKINILTEHGIKNFNLFLDTFRDKRSNQLPDEFDSEVVRPVLLTHLYLGRLHLKTIKPDKRQKLDLAVKSLDSYKFVVDYCDTHESAKSVVETEYEACKEMSSMLNLKIIQLTASDRL